MNDQIQMLIAHQLAYTFLSKVFYEPPNRELIDTLAADNLFDAFPLETGQPEAETGLALLRDFCASWSADDLEALQHDYRRLFVGPGHLLAAPWESVYRGSDRLLFDTQTLLVRHEYQRFGMPIPNFHNEPEDHLGLEFRFIAHLCDLALGASERNQPQFIDAAIIEIQQFLRQHLLQWAPECLNLVIENARTDYYQGCSRLALGCLRYTTQIMQVVTA